MNLEPKDWLEIISMVVIATASLTAGTVGVRALSRALDALTRSIQGLSAELRKHDERLLDLEWKTGLRQGGRKDV